jgi:short-subunit dehydrogenase
MILTADREWLDRLLRVNLHAPFILVQEFLPGMLAAEKGHIVTMTSLSSLVDYPYTGVYGAAKSGIAALDGGE